MNKKNYGWNPSTSIWENSKCLKSIADTSIIVCVMKLQMLKIVYQQIWQMLFQQI